MTLVGSAQYDFGWYLHSMTLVGSAQYDFGWLVGVYAYACTV